MNIKKISRNDPCHCGSGKKYKQCCQNKDSSSNNEAAKNRLLESVPELFNEAKKEQEEKNNLNKAEELYQKILTINPKHAGSLNNLGLLFYRTDRLHEATALFRKATQLEPSTKHFSNFSMTLPYTEALECLHKAINLNPGDPLAYNNVGVLLSSQQHITEAITYYKKALSINPAYTLALNNLAGCFMLKSEYQEAAHWLRKAILIDPHEALYRKSLLFCLCFDKQAFPDVYLKEARELDHVWQKVATPYQKWDCNAPTINTPLRVGLVSGDIGNHPVGYFLESVASSIDKHKIELFVYSKRAPFYEDETTQRIRQHTKTWRNIRALSDQQAAAQIHHDGIHILIDLAGYTTDTGISIFTWKPAPIQVSWLGYFASTGLACMDYFLADEISVPISHSHYFSEKIWYLPKTRLCFTSPSVDIFQTLANPPADHNGFITFGCFQNLSKLNDAMLKNWAVILRSCKNSKLLFKNKQLADAFIKETLLDRLENLGFDLENIILEPNSPRSEYFATYNKVDLMLDTFPYTGGTTTCDALWMGVPTLTLTGDTILERQGMAMLSCVGLEDWIAYNVDDYVLKAITHAKNINNLRQLRQQLRATMKASPLVDATRFAQHLESVFEKMWLKRNDTELSKLTKIDT